MTAHASTAHSFELHAGALRLALRPDLGGAIAGLAALAPAKIPRRSTAQNFQTGSKRSQPLGSITTV